MYKKVVSAILAAALCLSAFSSSAYALSAEAITAPSAILTEASTGKVIFEKNSHEKRPCASVTKIMTLLLVFEAIDEGSLDFDTVITASEHAASMGGSDIWLEAGEAMSADDMIKATAVASANDAAVALAEYISGSEDAFVEQMNKRAAQLKMNDTVFKNCNGLDEEGHVTSAHDVALMSRELMKHEKIFEYTGIWLDELRDGKTQIVNTNKLLKTYNGITGLKTGTTDDAGCCMSASAERDGVSLCAVVLGCDTGKERFSDAAALLDCGFASVCVEQLKLPTDMPTSVKVENGMEQSVNIKCNVNENVVTDKNESTEIVSEISLPETVQAPIEENQKIGTLVYKAGDEKLRSFDILAAGGVEQASFSKVFARLLCSLVAL